MATLVLVWPLPVIAYHFPVVTLFYWHGLPQKFSQLGFDSIQLNANIAQTKARHFGNVFVTQDFQRQCDELALKYR